MAFSSRERTEPTLSEINVTPLVDVMLVLLIIFMITAPMLSASVEVDLQDATVALPSTAEDHLIVTIGRNGRIFVADLPTDMAILAERVQTQLRGLGLTHVAVRGDRSVPYGTVLEVIDQLRAGGVKGVGLLMDPPAVAARETRP